jgi:Zn-dependent oligopeptidase
MNNLLLEMTDLPAFSTIRPEHVEPAIDELLARNCAQLENPLDYGPPFSWDNLIRPIEDMDSRVSGCINLFQVLKDRLLPIGIAQYYRCYQIDRAITEKLG